MTYPHWFEWISYGAIVATVILVFVFRKLWRRGKHLWEP